MSIYVARVFDKNTSNYLGIVFIHDNGYIMTQTGWGDFNYNFGSYGDKGILHFLTNINTDYFAKKVIPTWLSNSPVLNDKLARAIERNANQYADKILPSLQAAIKKGAYQVYEHTKNGQPSNTEP